MGDQGNLLIDGNFYQFLQRNLVGRLIIHNRMKGRYMILTTLTPFMLFKLVQVFKMRYDRWQLRKRPKTVENWVKSNFVLFEQFFDVFSAHDDRINYSSFALWRESQDTSLDYLCGVLWRIIFSTYKGVSAIFGSILDTLPRVKKIQF